MLNKEIFLALDELEKESRIPKQLMLEAIEAGLVSAFKKEYGFTTQIAVRINEVKGDVKVYAHRLIVDEVTDEDKEISLEDAQDIDPTKKVGDILLQDITPEEFSRIATQTARQVILQRITDIRRDMVVNEMSERTGEILSAIVRRKEGETVYVEITGSQMEGILMKSDQLPNEKYNVNDVIKVYIKKIRGNDYGAQVIVSRSAPGFVRRLFEMEVPEIRAGLVKIENCVREPGERTKIAIRSDDPNVDALGSCIGNKGTRINAILAELGGNEKVDIIIYSPDPVIYICNALSPSPVNNVFINYETKQARVIVPDEKLSLAIGRRGQNARLAAKLTGWKIDVRPMSSFQLASLEDAAEDANDGE